MDIVDLACEDVFEDQLPSHTPNMEGFISAQNDKSSWVVHLEKSHIGNFYILLYDFNGGLFGLLVFAKVS